LKKRLKIQFVCKKLLQNIFALILPVYSGFQTLFATNGLLLYEKKVKRAIAF